MKVLASLKIKCHPYLNVFTTVSSENDMQPSSGIGLSLVNELVKMLHGEIQVESEVKKGSVFKLVLHKEKNMLRIKC